jgi:ABC-type amino acid transport substrate-binding protein
LQDVPTVAQFVEANKDKVAAIGLDSPPARVAAGFLLRRGSDDFRDFLNVALEVLRSDGTLTRIASHWTLYNEFLVRSFTSSPRN